jgi:DNA-binding FrmR family transcriptional regulator
MHTIKDKKKLIDRVKRIAGQVASIERALEQESSCSTILRNIAACRGAMNSLMAEVMEGHIRMHLIEDSDNDSHEAAEELIDVVHSYLK